MAFRYINHGSSKYVQLSELGNRYDLSFSSHMVLADKIIALDGAKRKLMIAGFTGAQDGVQVIDLDKIRTVSLKKTYDSIGAGELEKKEMDDFITSIQLQFEQRKCGTVNSLVFYAKNLHIIQDLAKHERNAKSWHIILSKLINDGRDNKGQSMPEKN